MGSIRESIRETISNSNESAKKQISLMIDEQLLQMTDKVGEKLKTLTNNRVGSRNHLIELALMEYVKEAMAVLREDYSLDIDGAIDSIEDDSNAEKTAEIKNVLIVPGYNDGFESEFIGNHQWYSVRIAKSRIPEIDYVAVYRNAPYSCISHYAKVKDIQLYHDGKRIIYFDGPPIQLPTPIERGDRTGMRGRMYTSLDKLLKAKTIYDLE